MHTNSIDELRKSLETILKPDQILTRDSLDNRYSHIWRMSKKVAAKAVLLPKSTAEVSNILRWCYGNNQSIITHGGLTNLVGSTESEASDIILSLEKMKTIIEVDPQSRTITVESGAILEEVQKAALENSLMFPLNFGAKGSAQIGGAISTNAGGLRVFRFGMTRQLVLGLEVVLADGTILSSLKKIIKDNSGYDLKQLFIGAEGTLGIITKAVLKLVEAPKSRVSCLVGLSSYDNVVKLLKHMDAGLAGIMSGYELMWPDFYKAATGENALNKAPISSEYNYYVLIEALGSDSEKDLEKMTQLLELALESELIEDGAMADTASDLNWFWSIREDVHVIKSQCNYDHHFDISMPIAEIGLQIKKIKESLLEIEGVKAVYPFGHIADGNIHLIVDRVSEDRDLIEAINSCVYNPLSSIGGSVSAEHGIGLDKRKYLKYCRTEEEIKTMKLLKQSLDQKNILNSKLIFE